MDLMQRLQHHIALDVQGAYRGIAIGGPLAPGAYRLHRRLHRRRLRREYLQKKWMQFATSACMKKNAWHMLAVGMLAAKNLHQVWGMEVHRKYVYPQLRVVIITALLRNYGLKHLLRKELIRTVCRKSLKTSSDEESSDSYQSSSWSANCSEEEGHVCRELRESGINIEEVD